MLAGQPTLIGHGVSNNTVWHGKRHRALYTWFEGKPQTAPPKRNASDWWTLIYRKAEHGARSPPASLQKSNRWLCQLGSASSATDPTPCASCIATREDQQNCFARAHLNPLPPDASSTHATVLALLPMQVPNGPDIQPLLPAQEIHHRLLRHILVGSADASSQSRFERGGGLLAALSHSAGSIDVSWTLAADCNNALATSATPLSIPPLHGREHKCDRPTSYCRPWPQFLFSLPSPLQSWHASATWNADTIWKSRPAGWAISPSSSTETSPQLQRAVSNAQPQGKQTRQHT